MIGSDMPCSQIARCVLILLQSAVGFLRRFQFAERRGAGSFLDEVALIASLSMVCDEGGNWVGVFAGWAC